MTKKTFIGNASFLGVLTVLGIVLMVLRQTLAQDPYTPLFYAYFVAPIVLYFGIAGLVGLLIARNTGFSLTKTVAVVLRTLAAIFFVLPFFFFLIVMLPWAILRGLFAILMVVMLYAPWFWMFFGLFYGLSWAQQKRLLARRPMQLIQIQLIRALKTSTTILHYKQHNKKEATRA